MKKSLIILVFSALLANFHLVNGQPAESNNYKRMRAGFLNPGDLARPKVYWWCLNGNIDTVRARQEFIAMKNAGIGGFDIFEIGVPKEDVMIPGGPAFLSDESLKVIKFVINEAGKLGLSVGLNLASSWNAGGSWIPPEHGGKSIYFSKVMVRGTSDIQDITVPFPEVNFPRASLIGGTGKPMIPFTSNGRPAYYEEVAVLAVPANTERYTLDTSRIVNVSCYFDEEHGKLTWNAPAGDWEIYRYICSNSGQQLVMPSPHSAGLTIDHFDSTAVKTHLMYIINRLRPVIGDFRNTALKSFYLASYEARGFVWTSTLPPEFKKINGYDIYKFLPSFFNKELFNQDISKRIEADFKKTLSELMINNLYKNAKKICNSYGLKINCEAGGPGYPLYNGPAEPLKALGSLDIPRGEFWVNHERYYRDSNGKDSIDIMRVVKEVAAASHIYELGIVEEESFTSFQHWQEGPFDLKPVGDRAFCEGMNRVVFHGFSHNPEGTGSPGIVYHAGTHFNDKRVWWPKVKPFINYVSRISYILQESEFVADVLYYYGDKIPNAATAKNTHFTAGPGYDYEVINTEILLNNLSVENGKLVLTNGAKFSLLVLENEEVINPYVLNKLSVLADQGARIIGARPRGIAESLNFPGGREKGEYLLKKLWMNVSDPLKVPHNKRSEIYSGITSLEMLTALNLPPDLDYSDKESFLLDYIHYRLSDMDFYFLRNTTAEWISRECSFRVESGIPEIWDPVMGEIIPVTVFNQNGKYITIPVTLAPYGSYFVVFRKGSSPPHYTKVSAQDRDTPLMEFTREGIIVLNEGTYTLRNSSDTRKVKNKQDIQTIDGDWKVSFMKGLGAPDSVYLSGLASWTHHTDPGIRYYSGTGTYQKSFYYKINQEMSPGKRILLDLGNISEVAEVWLNGISLGIVWAMPYRYDITKIIKNGRNDLIVEVANNWSNRITGDAITGEKYTNTNITNVGRVPWSKVPLTESGLLGPVTIKSVNLFH